MTEESQERKNRSFDPGQRALLALSAAIAAGWAVCFWPARAMHGAEGIQWLTIAAFSCLIPGWFVVFLNRLAIFPGELAALAAQMILRLGSVSGVCLFVNWKHPEVGVAEFYGWVVLFYFIALFVETWVLRSRSAR